MALTWDKEFESAAHDHLKALSEAGHASKHDIKARRDGIAELFDGLMAEVNDPSDVTATIHMYKTKDGAELKMYEFKPSRDPISPSPTSAVLYSHGGGMICGNITEMYWKTLKNLAKASGVRIFAPEYRLAPEHKHPTLVEDVYAGLVFLNKNADSLNIDNSRIGVMGDSAGGGIAAAMSHMAKDRGLSPGLAKQILIYPMLDDRQARKKQKALEEFLVLWNEVDNETGWTALLGENVDTDNVSIYAAPGRATNFDGIPKTYLEVGGLDLFRDEGIAYAQKLAAAGVDVEFHLYAGVPHAWEVLAPEISVSERSLSNRVRMMQSF